MLDMGPRCRKKKEERKEEERERNADRREKPALPCACAGKCAQRTASVCCSAGAGCCGGDTGMHLLAAQRGSAGGWLVGRQVLARKKQERFHTQGQRPRQGRVFIVPPGRADASVEALGTARSYKTVHCQVPAPCRTVWLRWPGALVQKPGCKALFPWTGTCALAPWSPLSPWWCSDWCSGTPVCSGTPASARPVPGGRS